MKLICSVLLLIFFGAGYSQIIILNFIAYENYKNFYFNKSDKSLLINDVKVDCNCGEVFYDSVFNNFFVDQNNADSCYLNIEHPKYKSVKINLYRFKKLSSIDIQMINESNEYLISGMIPFRPERDLIVLNASTPLNLRQKGLIDSLKLTLVDSLCEGGDCYYYLKKGNGKEFDRVFNYSLLSLRKSGLFNAVGPYMNKTTILCNDVTVKLKESISVDSLELILSDVKHIQSIKKTRNYSYRIIFEEYLGLGIIDEISKMYDIYMIEAISPGINHLVELD